MEGKVITKQHKKYKGVYMITDSKHFYIGSTIDLYGRYRQYINKSYYNKDIQQLLNNGNMYMIYDCNNIMDRKLIYDIEHCIIDILIESDVMLLNIRTNDKWIG